MYTLAHARSRVHAHVCTPTCALAATHSPRTFAWVPLPTAPPSPPPTQGHLVKAGKVTGRGLPQDPQCLAFGLAASLLPGGQAESCGHMCRPPGPPQEEPGLSRQEPELGRPHRGPGGAGCRSSASMAWSPGSLTPGSAPARAGGGPAGDRSRNPAHDLAHDPVSQSVRGPGGTWPTGHVATGSVPCRNGSRGHGQRAWHPRQAAPLRSMGPVHSAASSPAGHAWPSRRECGCSGQTPPDDSDRLPGSSPQGPGPRPPRVPGLVPEQCCQQAGGSAAPPAP